MKTLFRIFILMVVCIANADAAELVYRYTAVLSAPFGSLSSGSLLTGTFSYDSIQTPQDFGMMTVRRYELSSFTLSSGSDVVSFEQTPGLSDRWIAVGDDDTELGQAQDFFSVRADRPSGFQDPLGGETVQNVLLFWADDDANANDAFALPAGDGDFAAYTSTFVNLESTSFDFVSGTITSVSLVPLPNVVVMFGFALMGLARRHKKAPI